MLNITKNFHQIRRIMLRNIASLIIPFLILSCEVDTPKTIGVYAFVDVTDGSVEIQSIIDNDLKQISNFTEVSEELGGNNGVEFKVFEINNLSESNSKTIVLNEGIPGMLGQNNLDRIDEVKRFNNQIKETFTSIQNKKSKELNNSKIYQNLCREFNGLNFSHDKNLIIIYSDMLENSELFSFYGNKSKIIQWGSNIEIAINYLESKDCAFPNLKKVETHIISNRKVHTDELINTAQSFWQSFFNAKGATVFFDSELNLHTNFRN